MLPIPTENKTWVAAWENTVKLNLLKSGRRWYFKPSIEFLVTNIAQIPHIIRKRKNTGIMILVTFSTRRDMRISKCFRGRTQLLRQP